MYKLIYNNMVVDLLKNIQYVRYLKNSKRWIKTDSQTANGVIGSNGDTIYHIQGRICTCPEELKQVEIYEIGPEEFEALSIQFSIQRKENEELRQELKDVREQLSAQNSLLQQILAKL